MKYNKQFQITSVGLRYRDFLIYDSYETSLC